jgi:hypothetical protein
MTRFRRYYMILVTLLTVGLCACPTSSCNEKFSGTGVSVHTLMGSQDTGDTVPLPLVPTSGYVPNGGLLQNSTFEGETDGQGWDQHPNAAVNADWVVTAYMSTVDFACPSKYSPATWVPAPGGFFEFTCWEVVIP